MRSQCSTHKRERRGALRLRSATPTIRQISRRASRAALVPSRSVGLRSRRFDRGLQNPAAPLSRFKAVLNSFGRREAELSRRGDFEDFPGRGMAAFARRRFLDLELAETRERYLFAA